MLESRCHSPRPRISFSELLSLLPLCPVTLLNKLTFDGRIWFLSGPFDQCQMTHDPTFILYPIK